MLKLELDGVGVVGVLCVVWVGDWCDVGLVLLDVVLGMVKNEILLVWWSVGWR